MLWINKQFVLIVLMFCASYVAPNNEQDLSKFSKLSRLKRLNYPEIVNNNNFTYFNHVQFMYRNDIDKKVITRVTLKVLGKSKTEQTKCYEYIWEIKWREYSVKRSAACTQYLLSKPPGQRPHFAIGGRITEPGEFPHMGAVGWRAAVGTWIFKCGSSLISSNFMLTAAHCSRVSSRDTSVANTVPEIVRLGDKNIIDVFANGLNPVDVEIQQIIVHPQYSAPIKYFDIAIIKLKNNVYFTKYVQPACLWPKFDTTPLGTKATLTGWGVIETASLLTSPELQAAEVDILNSQVCNNLLQRSCNRLWCGVAENQLCAGKLVGGVDACQGDSGGPLQVKINLPSNSQGAIHYLIGVTSFGIGCARANKPGIYTRVSSFIDWIEDVVWRSDT